MLDLPPEEQEAFDDELRRRFRRRYQLQEIAQKLFEASPDALKPRVTYCSRYPIRGEMICLCRTGTTVWANNLITCNSVWTCPLCSSKITERRVRELQTVLRIIPNPTLFLTLTFSHQYGDDLAELLRMIYSTWRRFKQGKGWNTLKERVGWWADVRTTELTYGWNGWHPHMHVLIWLDESLNPRRLKYVEEAIKERWLKVLAIEGGTASWDKGAYLTSTEDHISCYMNKMGSNWDIAREIAKYPTKVADARGSSPFQLLLDSPHDPEAARLFSHYAKAIKGHKQLSYSRSPDIRKVAKVRIMDDDEIMEMQTSEAEEVYRMDYKTFQELTHRGKRSDFLLALRDIECLEGSQVQGLVADILSQPDLEDEGGGDDDFYPFDEEEDSSDWQAYFVEE